MVDHAEHGNHLEWPLSSALFLHRRSTGNDFRDKPCGPQQDRFGHGITHPASGQSLSPSTVSVLIGGGTISLPAGHSAQFTASVQGTPNTAVTWSVTPNVGTVSNGFYTAPAVIASPETIVLTAMSVADPSKSASVAFTLQPISKPNAPPPVVSISLSPGTGVAPGGTERDVLYFDNRDFKQRLYLDDQSCGWNSGKRNIYCPGHY